MADPNFVVVSSWCQHCIEFLHTYGTELEAQNIKVIALDTRDQQKLTWPLKDLLWALQIDKVPALRVDGALMLGEDAFTWTRNGKEAPAGGHSTLIDIQRRIVLQSQGGTSPIAPLNQK